MRRAVVYGVLTLLAAVFVLAQVLGPGEHSSMLIQPATSTGNTALADADDWVLESSQNVGMTLDPGSGNLATLVFGVDPAAGTGGWLQWTEATDVLASYIGGTGSFTWNIFGNESLRADQNSVDFDQPISVQNVSKLVISSGQGGPSAGLIGITGEGITDLCWQAQEVTSADHMFRIYCGGKLEWAPGTGNSTTYDTILERTAADELGTGSGDAFRAAGVLYGDGGAEIATYLEIPQDGTVDAAGKIGIDTTDLPATGGNDQLVVWDDGDDVVVPLTPHGCVTLENLAAADDDYIFWTAPYAVTVTSAYCAYQGTAVTAADIDLADGEGNLMTMTDATCADGDSGTRPTVQAVSENNALVAGESLAFNVQNAVDPETMKTTICWTYTVTRQ
jgi:hypothetical protein